MKCEVGNIVLINNFKYPDGKPGTLHYFVIIGIDGGGFDLLPLEYLCFLISSRETKENYYYNVPIKKDSTNRLLKDSHVKCDYLYTGIKADDIIMIVGSVTQEQYDKFVDVYESLFS